jgi:OmpA-OmpF porin, OOP family
MAKARNAALAFMSVAALSVPSISMAQTTMKGPDSGWYAGGHLGLSDFDEVDETDTAFKVLGGYQINKNFAVEAGYIDFGKVTGAGTTVKGNAFDLVGVGLLPLANQFALYGKLGLARTEATASNALSSEKQDSMEVTYGFGVQYDFSPKLGIRGDWQLYSDVGDGRTDVTVLSLGVVYRFK